MPQALRRCAGFASALIHVLFLIAELRRSRFPFSVFPLGGDNSRDEGRRDSPVLALDAGLYLMRETQSGVHGALGRAFERPNGAPQVSHSGLSGSRSPTPTYPGADRQSPTPPSRHSPAEVSHGAKERQGS